MYERIAWNNFYKTGNIESFLEYKRFCKLSDIEGSNNICIDENIDIIKEDVGGSLSEFNQNERDSNKRGSV